MSVAHNIEEKVRTDDVHISERIDFSGLLLSQPVLEGLTKSGFKRPSPIQLQSIPLGRCGLDLIVQAKSGTGKTCVFTVIALEGLNLQTDALQVLILAPTREIAIQIREVVNSIGSCMPELKCHSFIGGTSVQQDKISLKECHVASGTPGRIKQLIELGALKTQSIRLFVLDEADKLLGGDLTETINWIYSSLPDNKQILALSATYPETLAQHLTRYMRNPTFVRLNITDPALIGIKQYHVIVPDSPLPNKVFEAKTEAVIKVLSAVSFEQCLIFSNLQTRAQSLQSELDSRNWPTQCIAGCLDQKDRSMAMEHLKTYKCRILISTDLTSRGIDADKVNMVINLDVPLDHETYLHRIGRAGRFGSHGAAISIVSKGKQEKELWAVERKCKTKIPKLPDPIPSDLATRYVALNLKLSDVITTEKIITQPVSPFQTYLPPDQYDYCNIEPCNVKQCDDDIANMDTKNGKEDFEEGHIDIDRERDVKKGGNGNDVVDDVGLSKSSETDLCASSSVEYFTALEERSMDSGDSSEVVSINSGLNLHGEKEGNQIQVSKRVKDGQGTSSLQNNLVSNGSSLSSEMLGDSFVVKGADTTTEEESLSRNLDKFRASIEEGIENVDVNDYECLWCSKPQEMICSSNGENDKYSCSCNTANKKDTGQESGTTNDEDKTHAFDLEKTNGFNGISNDKTPVNLSPMSQNDDANSKSHECSEKGNKKMLSGGVDCVVATDKIPEICIKTKDSKNSVQAPQVSYKPKRRKYPRPFAMSAFLKGLNENSTESQDDEEDDYSQSTVSSVGSGKEKDAKDATEISCVKNLGKEDTGCDLVKEIKELELHPTCVNGENRFQCVDLVISDSLDVSGIHRDDNELCDAAEQTGPCRETSLEKNAENDGEFPLHQQNQKQIENMTMTETLVISEQCLVTCNAIESHKEDECSKDDSVRGRGNSCISHERDSVSKSISELQEDFQHFCLDPFKVSIKDVCDSVISQLSEKNLQSNVSKNDNGLVSLGFSNVMETKWQIKTRVEMAKSERVGNPDIVKDFLKKASVSKSAETDADTKTTKFPGKNKGGKRKRGTGRWNDTQSWRDRGSDDQDWRSRKRDDDSRKAVGSSGGHSKGFDDLLREQQLLLKGEKEEGTDKLKKDDCSNVTDEKQERSDKLKKDHCSNVTDEKQERSDKLKKDHCSNVTDEKKERSDTLNKDDYNNVTEKRTTSLNSFDEVDRVRPNKAQSEIEAGTETTTTTRNDLNKKSDDFHGARPKLRQQTFTAMNNRNEYPSPDRVRPKSNPDKECQKLDQMHLEMLRKRKERKELAKLKQQTAINGESGNVKSTVLEKTHESMNQVENETKPVAEADPKSVGSATSTARTVSDCSIPQSDMKVQFVVDKQQDLVNGVSRPEQESVNNSVEENNQIASSAPADNTAEILDALETNDHLPRGNLKTSGIQSTELDEVVEAPRHALNSKCRVMKFVVEGLVLSSDSDDLEVSLSSNSYTYTSSVSGVSSSHRSKRKRGKAGKEIRIPVLRTSERSKKWSSSRSSHQAAPKSHSRKHHCSKTAQTADHNVKTEKKGKVSIAVKDIASHKPQTPKAHHRPKSQNAEVDVVNVGKLGKNEKMAVPPKSIGYHFNILRQKSNLKKHHKLNLSNNKSRSEELISPETFYHQSTIPPFFYHHSANNRDRHEHKHPNETNNYSKECNSSKYHPKKSSRRERHHHHHRTVSDESDLSDEDIDGSFDYASLYNWWSYWLSLYHNYINNSPCTSSYNYNYNPHSPYHHFPDYNYHPHHQHGYHNYYHYHQQQQQQSHGGPSLSASSPYFTMHHPSYYHFNHHHHHPAPNGMTDQHISYYNRVAASFQQKYIRHMTRVMKEMTSRYAGYQSDTDTSESESEYE